VLSYSPKLFKIKLAHISKFASLFLDISKSPYSVVPSVSEASTPHFVLPRVAWHPKGKKGDLSADASGLHRVRLLASFGKTLKGASEQQKYFRRQSFCLTF
jgi:hypothetical protein